MRVIQDSRYLGGVNEVTIITPIKQGRVPDSLLTYRDQLKATLDSVQNRELRGIPTPVRLIPTIHFARWIIWEPPGQADAPAMLIFESNFDGSMWQYLRDFADLIASDVDRIWGNCEGYPAGGARDFDAFWAYAVAHQVQPAGFYAALTDETVKKRLLLRKFRQNFDQFVHENMSLLKQAGSEFEKRFKQFLKDNEHL